MKTIYDPTLQLYIPFRECDAPTYASKDARGFPVVKTGAVWHPQGHSFDRIDDVENVGIVSDFYLGTGDITVIVYAMPSGSGNGRCIFSKDDGTGTIGMVLRLLVNDKLNGWLGGAAITGLTAIADSISYQLAISRYAGTQRLFVNGNQEAAGAAIGNIDTGRVLRIGAYVDSLGALESYFGGIMGAFFIYSKGMFQPEIMSHYQTMKKELPWL